MSAVTPLDQEELPSSCYLYKHSTTCPLSARAAIVVDELSSEIPIYRINVREQRKLSNWFADAYGVPHESPQLVLIREGKVLRVWNHESINRRELTG
jgi:bacillithiol system protein YtxJ